MNDNSKIDRHTASVRRTGLLIALAAFLVLLVLAAYRLPLFHKEFYGTIVGVSETHNEAGSELVAAVQLETGDQVLVYLPRELLKSKSNGSGSLDFAWAVYPPHTDWPFSSAGPYSKPCQNILLRLEHSGRFMYCLPPIVQLGPPAFRKSFFRFEGWGIRGRFAFENLMVVLVCQRRAFFQDFTAYDISNENSESSKINLINDLGF